MHLTLHSTADHGGSTVRGYLSPAIVLAPTQFSTNIAEDDSTLGAATLHAAAEVLT